jgi:hypothetical protein
MPTIKLLGGPRASGHTSKKPNGRRPTRTLIVSVSRPPHKKPQ